MKTTKLLVLLAGALILLAGCKKDENDPILSITEIEGGVINFTSEAPAEEAIEITVTTNQSSWDAVSDQTWCKVTKTAGKFTVTADPNTPSVMERTATITVSAGMSAPKTISVRQTGVNATALYDISIDEDGKFSGTVAITESGKVVTLSYRTHGGSSTATSTDIALGNSNASGIVTVSGELTDKIARVIEFSTDNYTTSTRITFGMVPVGFLTGKATDLMTLAEARAFAAFHGGKLPLVGGKTIYKWSEYVAAMSTTTVDGFGYYNASSWPSDLPTTYNGNLVSYLTNTEDTEYGDNEFWLITPNNGKVAPGTAMTIATDKFAVTCLP